MSNLLDDDSTTYTYDALNRLTNQGRTSTEYDSDGVLVAQTTDLASPLTQVLQTSHPSVRAGLQAECRKIQRAVMVLLPGSVRRGVRRLWL